MRPASPGVVAGERDHERAGLPSIVRSRAATAITLCLLAGAVLAACANPVGAQSIVDGSDATIGRERTQAILASVGLALRSPDARVSELRLGRQGAICGAVEVRNRMGAYTGPRPFVFDPVTRFLGRLPEGPELRNPASMADFNAMEQARARYAQNCINR
jgi:hypothetical protein